MSTNWLALGAAAFLTLSGAAFAQQPAPPATPAPGANSGAGQGGMMQRGEMGHHGMMWGRGMERGGMMMGRRFCENNDPVAPRMLGRLESTIRPTEAQKPEMDALRSAATKAEAIVRASCPTAADDDRSPPARLAQMEKRMTAMAEAIKTVRPAFDALYAKLDDKQRDRLRWSRGHH